MIGGNLATNAGGIKFIKHNSMHANCVGLKAVLPDGRILDNMTTLRKDNTGYDLKHLFIGSEGTLGIITECALLCPPMLNNRHLAMLACDSWSGVLDVLKTAKSELSDLLQAIEVMDSVSMESVTSQNQALNIKSPFDKEYPFYMLIEIASKETDVLENDTENPTSDLDRFFQLFE